MKKRNVKGFTLAELLVVIAIIAILIAIAIPVFTAQAEKAKQSADAANIRSAYAAAVVNALEGDSKGSAETEAVMQSDSWSKMEDAEIGGVSVSEIDKTVGEIVTVSIDGDDVVFTAGEGADADDDDDD